MVVSFKSFIHSPYVSGAQDTLVNSTDSVLLSKSLEERHKANGHMNIKELEIGHGEGRA